MASNINFNSIDETYPIAGRDNDSQGFRDNFSVMKNNFEAAKSEIEDLQLNTARLDDSNNFNNNTITNVNLSSYSEELFNGGSVQLTPTLLEIGNGPLQVFTVNPTGSSPTTFQFTLTGFNDFGEKLSKVRVLLFKGTTNPADVTVNFVVSEAVEIKLGKNFPADIFLSTNPSGTTLNQPGYSIPSGSVQKTELTHVSNPILLEFWSFNSGNTIYCDYIGQYT